MEAELDPTMHEFVSSNSEDEMDPDLPLERGKDLKKKSGCEFTKLVGEPSY